MQFALKEIAEKLRGGNGMNALFENEVIDRDMSKDKFDV